MEPHLLGRASGADGSVSYGMDSFCATEWTRVTLLYVLVRYGRSSFYATDWTRTLQTGLIRFVRLIHAFE
jgi:hypothetical protein